MMRRRGVGLGLLVAGLVAGLAGPGRAVEGDAIAVSIVPGSETRANVQGTWQYLPDEHAAMLPAPGDPATKLIFTAGLLAGRSMGAVVLTTRDFRHFAPAPDYDLPVLTTPLRERMTACGNPATRELYDQGYAAPGSVLADPAGPPGSLLMLFEAENYCRGGAFVPNFYVSVGFARSADYGKTWPEAGRFAAITSPLPKPTSSADQRPIGTAIPSGIVEGGYLYAFFTNHPGNIIQAARARLGEARPSFQKFTRGSGDGWAEPGVGGVGSAIIAAPAGRRCGQVGVAQLDVPRGKGPLFLMTMECHDQTSGAWFFATTRDLRTQVWSAPRLIAGSEGKITNIGPDGGQGCNQGRANGFDGWYPSFISPTAAPGHLGMEGYVLYADGCLTGTHNLNVREFAIAAGR